jgi:uncharacterized protein (DUF433 family)
MERIELLERIELNPAVMTGKPIIRGTRLIVQFILNLLAHGATVDDILIEYEELTKDDILACLLYASETLESKETEIEIRVRKLPENLKRRVLDYIEFLLEKHQGKRIGKREFKFDWEGGLSDMKDEFTSVELQHKAAEWR